MRTFFGFFLLLLMGCHNQETSSQTRTSDIPEMKNFSTVLTQNDSISLLLQNESKDSIAIVLEGFDSLLFKNGEWKVIKTYFTEFNGDYFYRPDIQYARRGGGLKEKGCGSLMFDSEVGEDSYCILYAYFLQQKNGKEEFRVERQNLITIYKEINSIFQTLKHGGTYFGHNYYRIAAYSEYAISNYKGNEHDYERGFDMRKQKEFYIGALKQIIDDEIEHDNMDLDASSRKEKKQLLVSKVDHIGVLITNYFYLKSAREFQYSRYNY